jgi:hypothetical protein
VRRRGVCAPIGLSRTDASLSLRSWLRAYARTPGRSSSRAVTRYRSATARRFAPRFARFAGGGRSQLGQALDGRAEEVGSALADRFRVLKWDGDDVGVLEGCHGFVVRDRAVHWRDVHGCDLHGGRHL